MTSADPVGFQSSFLDVTHNSFVDFVHRFAPETLPQARMGEVTSPQIGGRTPSGTTIVALTFDQGVVLAGDRRATMGNLIASHTIEKVHITDATSAVGIAGAAGLALELVKLFQVELEHYEKIEGTSLSLEGKANRLAGMLRGNLGLALQGLAVLPLFVGVSSTGDAAIFSFDVTGGKYREGAYHAVGSGSTFAKSSLKKRWAPDADSDSAVRAAIEALIDAADDDSATGGPDLVRRIAPQVVTVTSAGVEEIAETYALDVAASIIAHRSVH